jgi:hypothetical protein
MNKILIPTSEDVEGNGEFIAKIPKRKSFGWALIPGFCNSVHKESLDMATSKKKPFICEDFALKIQTCFEVSESFRTVLNLL